SPWAAPRGWRYERHIGVFLRLFDICHDRVRKGDRRLPSAHRIPERGEDFPESFRELSVEKGADRQLNRRQKDFFSFPADEENGESKSGKSLVMEKAQVAEGEGRAGEARFGEIRPRAEGEEPSFKVIQGRHLFTLGKLRVAEADPLQDCDRFSKI